MALQALKLQRKTLRTAFTNSLKKFHEALNLETRHDVSIKSTFRVFQDKANRLFLLDADIQKAKLDQTVLESEGKDELSADEVKAMETEESYREKFCHANVLMESYLDETQNEQRATHSTNRHNQSTKDDASDDSDDGADSQLRNKYKRLSLPSFNGDPRQWLRFWSKFKPIHEDVKIKSDTKMEYLMDCMEKESKAYKLVSTFQQSGEFYETALEHLRKTFASDEILTRVYANDLLCLVSNRVANRDIGFNIVDFYFQIETYIRALDALALDNDTFLYYMVESTLPDELLMQWQRAKLGFLDSVVKKGSLNSLHTATSGSDHLAALLQFLHVEVIGKETVQVAHRLADATLGLGHPSPPAATATALVSTSKRSRNSHTSQSNASRQSGTVSSPSSICIFCENKHASAECRKTAKLSLDQRMAILTEKKACFRCLQTGHPSTRCQVRLTCPLCTRRHLPIVCPEAKNVVRPTTLPASNPTPNGVQKQPSNPPNPAAEPFHPKASRSANYVYSARSSEEFLETVVVRAQHHQLIRILLDTCGQYSYITYRKARALQLQTRGTITLHHDLFGKVDGGYITHEVYVLELESLDCTYRSTFVLFGTDEVCAPVPRFNDNEIIRDLESRNIHLSDVGPNKPLTVDILLGTGNLARVWMGSFHEITDSLTAVRTKLGWAIIGQYPPDPLIPSSVHFSTSIQAIHISNEPRFWEIDVLGIPDPFHTSDSPGHDKLVQQQFEENLRIDPDGRYEISLPWKIQRQELGNNFHLAKARLTSTTRKLKQDGQFERYSAILSEWEQLGVIEKVTEESGFTHYLPHRGVYRPESTSTPLRPVFDASCKDRNGRSLNSMLEAGPNLIAVIPVILLSFRLHAVGVTSDIRKAFLQIGIREDERDALRFLWWEPDGKTIRIYRHKRVVFGLTCSPFILAATVHHHLNQYIEAWPDTVDRLRRALYVDDNVTSVESQSACDKFQKEAQDIMLQGKFELTKWKRTGDRQPSGLDLVSDVLGLKWNCTRDTLHCDIKAVNTLSTVTRRVALSAVHRIFDPLGLFSPALLLPKILIQKSWESGLDWDTELPSLATEEFLLWHKQLPLLSTCEIPRYYGGTFDSKTSVHVFSDASQSAYAAAVFGRFDHNGQTTVQLLQAVARVAPIKKAKPEKDSNAKRVQRVSIPRLELLGASIGARLFETVKTSLPLPPELPVFYWTDSKTVLFWITKKDDWRVFVRNRVNEIQALTNPASWRHVPGELNPADLPSRGCTPEQFVRSKWWEGPQWLHGPPESWPQNPVDFSEHREEIAAESSRSASIHVSVSKPTQDPLLATLDERISNFRKIVRCTAWIRRFVFNCRQPKKQRGVLTSEELKAAEQEIFRRIQSEYLTADDLRKIQTFHDTSGLIRVRTRALDLAEYSYPILLPTGSIRIVQKFLQAEHLRHHHAGVQTMLQLLRQDFWILRARKSLQFITRQCHPCKRQNAPRLTMPEPPLPLDRTDSLGPVFNTTGVDLAGPLHLRDGSKSWVVLFTCAVYRAIHLELVSAISTPAFIGALRRFISRRGRIRKMRSDNGTNFQGTVNLLKSLNWEAIHAFSATHRIEWTFNPPTAAWWGGFWERMVQSVKRLLRRTLGKSTLNYEELYTVLCDVENIINSRPLTYFSEGDEVAPISPASFLRDIAIGETPDLDLIESTSLNNRLRYMNKVKSDLRERFRKEYLASLVYHGQNKPKSDIQPDDIVLIESDNRKRVDWTLGKVLQVFPGKDGLIRSVKLKTSVGELTRPIQRLFMLEMSPRNLQHQASLPVSIQPSEPESADLPPELHSIPTPALKQKGKRVERPTKEPPISLPDPDPKVTRTGRLIRPPKKLTLVNNAMFVKANSFFVL